MENIPPPHILQAWTRKLRLALNPSAATTIADSTSLFTTPEASETNLSKHIKQLRCCVRPLAVFNASPAEEENADFKAFVIFPIQKLSWISLALEVLRGRGSETEGFGSLYYYRTRIEQNLSVFSSSMISCQWTPNEQRSWRRFMTCPSIIFP